MSPSPFPYSPALHLYRAALRACRTFPVVPLRTKLAYNARDLMDLYRHVQPGEQLDTLIQEGYRDIEFLNSFHLLTDHDLATLFKVHLPRKAQR